MQLLQIVDGQTIGFHYFPLLQMTKSHDLLFSNDNDFQITESKYLTEFLPLAIEFIEGITSSGSYRNPWTLDARVGRWTVDAGLWTLDCGQLTVDAGLWTLDAGLWTLDSGHWTLDSGR